MVEWIEYARIAGAFVGALGIATLAKLYHDKVVAGKDTELKIKDAELARVRADLGKAEARAQSAEQDAVPAHRDLTRLRSQLGEMLERLAQAMQVQAASLYIPLFNAGDERGSPGGDDQVFRTLQTLLNVVDFGALSEAIPH